MTIAVPASTNLAPARTPFSSLKKQVLVYVVGMQSDSELNEQAGESLNAGIDELNTVNWRKLVTYQDITVVAAQADYTVNSDFREPRHCYRLDSSSNPDGQLGFFESKVFEERFPSAKNAGSPNYYTIFHDARTFSLNLLPTSSWASQWPKIRLRYHRRLPRLVADVDILDAWPEMEQWLIWNARAHMASYRRPDVLRYAAATARRLWTALIADDHDTETDWSGW